ncbi:MAG: FtsW/RodA/SpoVE family cell cycle protein, partial [Pseudomonadota bacterium]|nr:FtsW/RodA/SpoVE family cell cycle protein [Pseudomonadota bacterium]
MMLYSVADGFEPWSIRHLTRLIFGLALMITVAILDIKFWFRIAYFVYVIGLLALLSVEFLGDQMMGAKRWLDLGLVTIQPSEPMRVGLMLALARYYH